MCFLFRSKHVVCQMLFCLHFMFSMCLFCLVSDVSKIHTRPLSDCSLLFFWLISRFLFCVKQKIRGQR